MSGDTTRDRLLASFGPDDAAAGIKSVVPFVTTIVLSLFMLLPVGTGLGGAALPHLTLISVFYFLSRRPLTMPYSLCAVSGLLLDLWLDVPLGLNMLLMVLTRLFVVNQLKYYKGRSRFLHWGVFAFLSFGLFTISYVLMSFGANGFLPLAPVALQWLVTALSYGPVGFILGRIRRLMM